MAKPISVLTAVEMLQSTKYTTSKLDDIYDFLYGSYILGEAEQLVDERKVKKALRHYESLDSEMDYKSKVLNRKLKRLATEVRQIKAQLGKSAADPTRILEMVFRDQGGDFTTAKQKDAFMRKAKKPLAQLKRLGFPFNDEDAVMGLIVSPMMGMNNEIEYEDMGLEYAVPNQETLDALNDLAVAVAELY